jgi:hypothetical protein
MNLKPKRKITVMTKMSPSVYVAPNSPGFIKASKFFKGRAALVA